MERKVRETKRKKEAGGRGCGARAVGPHHRKFLLVDREGAGDLTALLFRERRLAPAAENLLEHDVDHIAVLGAREHDKGVEIDLAAVR